MYIIIKDGKRYSRLCAQTAYELLEKIGVDGAEITRKCGAKIRKVDSIVKTEDGHYITNYAA
jgi:hypothetical protein